MYIMQGSHSAQLLVNRFKLLKNWARRCTIVQGISSKMARKEFSIFIIFSDAYTCSYVA